MQGRVVLLYLLCHRILQAVGQFAALLVVQLLIAQAHEFVGNIFLVNHETYEHVLVGQFFLEALGKEAVEHVVVLHGRVASDSLETAMVIGEYQSVG